MSITADDIRQKCDEEPGCKCTLAQLNLRVLRNDEFGDTTATEL